MSKDHESQPDSSDQGRRPQDPIPESPFAARYERPDNQALAEFELIDAFRAKYPENAQLLYNFLTTTKQFAGIQIQDLKLDRPIAGLELSDAGYIEGDRHMIYSVIELKRAAPEDDKMEILEGSPAELEQYAISRNTRTMQADGPAAAHDMVASVYGLVGAEVIHARTDGGRGLTIRKGVYEGVPVYFEETRTVGPNTGVVSYGISLVAENHALFDANDEIYGANLEECMELTGLNAHDVHKMNQSGELTRSNFRDQAALFQAVNEAMQLKD